MIGALTFAREVLAAAAEGLVQALNEADSRPRTLEVTESRELGSAARATIAEALGLSGTATAGAIVVVARGLREALEQADADRSRLIEEVAGLRAHPPVVDAIGLGPEVLADLQQQLLETRQGREILARDNERLRGENEELRTELQQWADKDWGVVGTFLSDARLVVEDLVREGDKYRRDGHNEAARVLDIAVDQVRELVTHWAAGRDRHVAATPDPADSAKVGDDLGRQWWDARTTGDPGDVCDRPVGAGWHCSREVGHGGQHVATDRWNVMAIKADPDLLDPAEYAVMKTEEPEQVWTPDTGWASAVEASR